MTQVAAAQGSLKLLFNGEAPAGSAAALGSGSRDPFCCFSELKSAAHIQYLRLGLYSSSTSSTRSRLFIRLGTHYRAGSEGILDEYDYDSEAEEDELGCFRALVLDISYRFTRNFFLDGVPNSSFFGRGDCLYFEQIIGFSFWIVIRL